MIVTRLSSSGAKSISKTSIFLSNMDENAPLPSNSVDAFNGYSDAAVAASTMKTYNFILAKYRDEFQAALNYDEKKDRKYQNQMRRLARERERLRNNPQPIEI
jgi:hypothetical protein